MAITIVIVLGNNHQWLLKLVGMYDEKLDIYIVSEYLLTRCYSFQRGKKVAL